MDDKETIYVIKEQGSLGLFADPISDEEEETIEENFNKQTAKEDN